MTIEKGIALWPRQGAVVTWTIGPSLDLKRARITKKRQRELKAIRHQL